VKAVLSFNQVREISNYLSNPPMILSHPLKINRYQIHSDTTISFGCVSGSVKELTNIVDAINENSN
jgi:nitrate reductase cytochrome c-type subunit